MKKEIKGEDKLYSKLTEKLTKDAEELYSQFVQKLAKNGIMYDNSIEKRILFAKLKGSNISLKKDIKKMKDIMKALDDGTFILDMLD